MTTISQMAILGVLAGFIATFWTRILRPNMIFGAFGKWLNRLNDAHIINTTKDSPLIKLVKCAFCLQIWLGTVFIIWYVITFTPPAIPCIIGVLGAWGAGNFTVELVNVFRNEDL
jgi:hypothetical protein